MISLVSTLPVLSCVSSSYNLPLAPLSLLLPPSSDPPFFLPTYSALHHLYIPLFLPPSLTPSQSNPPIPLISHKLYISSPHIGFFRNWKKVCVTVSGYTLKWASTSETRSKWYAMKGATVAKTMQYRFQITNMTELRERESTGGSSYSGKEGLKRCPS